MMRVIKLVLFLIVVIFAIMCCRESIVEYNPEIKTGDLYIYSNPEGAEILFNFTKTGKTTPDSLVKIQPGDYSVTVRLLGVGEETVNVNIAAGEKKYVSVDIN